MQQFLLALCIRNKSSFCDDTGIKYQDVLYLKIKKKKHRAVVHLKIQFYLQ